MIAMGERLVIEFNSPLLPTTEGKWFVVELSSASNRFSPTRSTLSTYVLAPTNIAKLKHKIALGEWFAMEFHSALLPTTEGKWFMVELPSALNRLSPTRSTLSTYVLASINIAINTLESQEASGTPFIYLLPRCEGSK
ncbi:unnamed protein product [Mucor hiemalis]